MARNEFFERAEDVDTSHGLLPELVHIQEDEVLL